MLLPSSVISPQDKAADDGLVCLTMHIESNNLLKIMDRASSSHDPT